MDEKGQEVRDHGHYRKIAEACLDLMEKDLSGHDTSAIHPLQPIDVVTTWMQRLHRLRTRDYKTL